MTERVIKSQKMVEPHMQAQNVRAHATLAVRRKSGTHDGAGHERNHKRAREAGQGPCGRQARKGLQADGRASRGGWVSRQTHRLVRPLGLGDEPIDPCIYIYTR
jgi:hypothetical protein